ncbi:hypothetical protein VTJ04DRAFT_8817 [Mycothermus thermophilus]|uniref:uncharacterized protein n=1 Tax=Humicola insolens TaxID=85995 RepID=UPI0037442203
MSSSTPHLKATYTSLTNAPFTLSFPISVSPTAPDTNTTLNETDPLKHKTAYLSVLRQSVASLQATINKELTARMEEDKAREAAAGNADGGKKKGRVVDDEKEEENYGEEVVEEE